MLQYVKKAQVLFTEAQFEVLEKISEEEQKKISTLVREAVEVVYLKEHRQKKIRQSAEKILKMSLPTTPWEKFEEEYTSQKYK